MVAETIISFEERAPTVAEIADRIAATLRHYPYLVAEQENRIVGYAYGSPHRARAAYRNSVDVTVYVDPDAHRQGIGRALYADLLAALGQAGFHAAFAGIALPNAASVGLHEALGFRPVGIFREVGFKFGQWHDVGWWQILLPGPDTR